MNTLYVQGSNFAQNGPVAIEVHESTIAGPRVAAGTTSTTLGRDFDWSVSTGIGCDTQYAVRALDLTTQVYSSIALMYLECTATAP